MPTRVDPLDTGASALPAAGREGKQEALVQAMFDRVAPRYDLANAVLSLGQDAHWRRVVARAARPAGRTFLDVAAGPGNVAQQLLARGARHVTALDLSFNMLAEGARRGLPDVGWVNGDAQRLPVGDAAVDGVTISFGLRNIPDPERALAEFARVTRPGGTLVVCEFAAPTNPTFRTVYLRVPGRGPAAHRAPGVLGRPGLHLPGRVDPAVAGPSDHRRLDARRRVAGRAGQGPLRRDRRGAPRHAARVSRA